MYTFKKRYSNHKKSFNHEKYENETELSKEHWKIKRKQFEPQVSWKILRRCSPFSRTSMKCNLCLTEKLEIALYRGKNMLNKKSELVSKCRHINQHSLKNHDTND